MTVDDRHTGTPATAPRQEPGRLQQLWAATSGFRPVVAVTVGLYIVMAATQSGFFTVANTQNMLTAVSALWIVSMGMTFVLITSGVDLSVGATAALSGIFFAKIVEAGVPGWPAVALTLLFGLAIGAVLNGLLIGRFGMSFFVITLAAMTAMTGIVNLWSNTASFAVDSPVPAQLIRK